MIDYYAVLGVSADADVSVIKDTYRKLAKKCHPDVCPGDKAAEERFKEIGEAWEVLGDPQRRSKYDLQRKKKPGASASPKKGTVPMGKVDFENLMGQFDTFFGKATTPPPGQKSAPNPLDGTDLFEKFMGIKKK